MPTPPQSSSSDLSLHLLSNGRYRVKIGARGEGCSSLGELRLIGGSNPPEIHEKGMFLFLRDLDRDRVWSAGLEPTSVLPRIYEIEKSQDRFVISRMDGDIQLRMECCVVPDHDAELRRLQLTNSGSQTRKLELSSYAEVVLNDPAAHDSHPAFSKLFLQTEFVPESSALLVRRRPRSPEEGYPCLVHAILDRPVDEYETDRARFLGRRKHPEQARALRGPDPLSCTTGNVLDPIVSLRSRFRLKPGESIEICLLLGAPPTRAEALSLVQCYAEAETRDAVFREAARAASHRETMIDEATSFPATAPSGDEPRVDEAHEESSVEDRAPEEELLFFNGYGGFNEEGTEYVIRLPWRKGKGLLYPPQAWINVLANENFGALLSETGAGYTWSDNSRLGKLTPWQNDPVLDPHSEAFYLRDEEDGSYGSPLPGPTPFAAPYEVRHGFGYTRCQVRSHGILCDTTVFVGRDDPIRFVRIQLRNESNRSRRLSLFAYARLLLADSFTAQSQELVSEATASPGRLRARGAGNANGSPLHALADLVVESTSATIHTTAKLSGFLGLAGTLRRPHCLEHSKALEFEEGRGDQACFAQQVEFELERGSSSTVVFLLGGAASQEALEAAFERYQRLATVDAAEEEVVAFWKQQLSRVRILTPSRELDLMVNGWLPYQTLACRIWGRSALYQSGGAFGFRDQLQDAARSSPRGRRRPGSRSCCTPPTSSWRGTSCTGGTRPRAAASARASPTTWSGSLF